MEICHVHDIAYKSVFCPVCKAEERISDLEGEIRRKDEEIEELKEQLKRGKNVNQ